MGAAISCFSGSKAVCVPRSRFLPVKTTDDLARMQSDLFQLSADGELLPTCENSQALPVALDGKYFGNLISYQERFPHGIPSLKECGSFSVRGDVLFGKDVICKGSVKVENLEKEQLKIEDETVLN